MYKPTKEELKALFDECNRMYFWEGRVTQKSYMEQLSGIKDEMFAHQRALTEKFAKVFNQVLSECSHCDNLIGTIESL